MTVDGEEAAFAAIELPEEESTPPSVRPCLIRVEVPLLGPTDRDVCAIICLIGKMNDLHAPFFALARPSHLWFELDRFLLINVSSSFLLEYDTIPIF